MEGVKFYEECIKKCEQKENAAKSNADLLDDDAKPSELDFFHVVL